MVYVEGEATMNTYEDAEGQKRTSLNVVQRELTQFGRIDLT
jgi:single-stranded DNA-binding protein